MEYKISMKKIYIGIGLFLLTISLLFHFAIFYYFKNIHILILMLLYTLIILGCVAVFAFLSRKKVSLFSDRLCQTIEDMINDKDDIFLFQEEETLLSRITHQILRLYKITKASHQNANMTKQDLQQLISDISHQVKTPVANLKMINTTLLNRTMTPAKRNFFLQANDKQLDKLDFLMSSLIKTSRLETGIIRLVEEPFYLYETIALALGNILLTAERKNLDIKVNCSSDLVIHHDVKWTSEALFNIFDNAVKYTDENGSIQVIVELLEMYTKINIKDNGKGIPENHYTEIFKRFYREPDTHHTDGIGIGLYLARKIITMQGGYITVSSEIGIGTTFSIFLLNK